MNSDASAPNQHASKFWPVLLTIERTGIEALSAQDAVFTLTEHLATRHNLEHALHRL